MNTKLFSIILVSLLIQSCCFTRGKEIDRVNYTVEEKAKIPYTDSQVVNFTSNEDYEFSLNTEVYSGFNSNQDHCEDYTSFDFYIVNLVSELPALDIKLSLRRNYNETVEEEFTSNISIEINQQWFYYDMDQPLESIELNEITYTDVYRYNPGNEESPISEIFFNEAVGILKINYSNGDYVQIDS